MIFKAESIYYTINQEEATPLIKRWISELLDIRPIVCEIVPFLWHGVHIYRSNIQTFYQSICIFHRIEVFIIDASNSAPPSIDLFNICLMFLHYNPHFMLCLIIYTLAYGFFFLNFIQIIFFHMHFTIIKITMHRQIRSRKDKVCVCG